MRTRPISGAARIRPDRSSRSRCRKGIVWPRPAHPMPRTSSSSPTSRCVGGGPTNIRRSTMPATGRAMPRMVADPLGGAIEIHHFRGIRVPELRPLHQPANVFYDPKSSESFTPYWSTWDAAPGATFRPRRDDTLAGLARDAIVEYWTIDGHNLTSPAGIKMIEPTFMAAWNWDATAVPRLPDAGPLGRRAKLGDGDMDRRQGAGLSAGHGRCRTDPGVNCRPFRRCAGKGGRPSIDRFSSPISRRMSPARKVARRGSRPNAGRSS